MSTYDKVLGLITKYFDISVACREGHIKWCGCLQDFQKELKEVLDES